MNACVFDCNYSYTCWFTMHLSPVHTVQTQRHVQNQSLTLLLQIYSYVKKLKISDSLIEECKQVSHDDDDGTWKSDYYLLKVMDSFSRWLELWNKDRRKCFSHICLTEPLYQHCQVTLSHEDLFWCNPFLSLFSWIRETLNIDIEAGM